MSTFYPVVMAQIDFACAVLDFIRKLLRSVLPGLVRDKAILGSREQFKNLIDLAFSELDPHEASERDYRLAVAGAACNEVATLCGLLTDVCLCTGFEKVAVRYLDHRRLMALVLRQDEAKLAALTGVVESGDRNAGRMLMRVGAILDGRPDTYDEMDSAAKRKATTDTRRIIAEMRALASDMERKVDDGKSEILGAIATVGRKVEKTRGRRKRRSKYSDAAREACLACWNAAQNNAEVKNSINTRITYESVFKYFGRSLAKFGLTTARQFKAVLHAAQSRECEERRRNLHAQQDAARQKSAAKTSTRRGKNGIIQTAKQGRTWQRDS